MPTGLPPGLGINASTGVLSGDPITPGTFTFTVQVKDANGLIARSSQEVIIYQVQVTGDAHYGVVDAAYSYTGYAATGGVGPYTWAIASGALPDGVTIASGTGYLSGTPTTEETATFTVRATDANAATGDLADTIDVYAADGVWFTRDGSEDFVRSPYGDSWPAAKVSTPIAAGCVVFYYWHDLQTVIALQPAGGNLSRSTDGGRTWTEYTRGISTAAGNASMAYDGTYYYMANSTVYPLGRSTDLVAWTAVGPRTYVVCAMNGAVFCTASGGAGQAYFYKTTDGATWAQTSLWAVPDVEFASGSSDTRMVNSDRDRYSGTYSIYCVSSGSNRHIYKLTGTTPTAALVETIVSASEFTGLATDGNDGWVALIGGDIYYSTDAGETWAQSASTRVPGSSGQSPIDSDGMTFAVTTSTGLMYSTDGGATWTTATTDLGTTEHAGICAVVPP